MPRGVRIRSHIQAIIDGPDDVVEKLERSQSKRWKANNTEDVIYIEPVRINSSQAIRSMDVRKSELLEQEWIDSEEEI
jgi:hypothetical protein